MSNHNQPVCINPMQIGEIDEVVALERAAYGANWIRKDYGYELENNPMAHYFVLRLPHLGPQLISHAGFWLIGDQSHINTIVTHPAWRRLGLAEWMLITLLEQSRHLGALEATLEARVSNAAAISLYQKYRFQEVGYRRRYYHNNNEDALILTTPALAHPNFQRVIKRHKRIVRQRLAQLIDKIN